MPRNGKAIISHTSVVKSNPTLLWVTLRSNMVGLNLVVTYWIILLIEYMVLVGNSNKVFDKSLS